MLFAYAFLSCRHLYWWLCLRFWLHADSYLCFRVWRVIGWLCIYIDTTTTITLKYIYHHQQKPPPHSASCSSVNTVSAPVGGSETPPVQVAMGETTMCAGGVFVPTDEGETPSLPVTSPQAQGAKVRVQGAKLRTSISTSRNGMQQQHATPTTTTIDQLRISTSAGGVHDAAMIATCVRAHNSNFFHDLPLLCALMQVAMM